MYEETRSLVTVLDFLREHAYAELPLELWDRLLWFYEKIEHHLEKSLSEAPPENTFLLAHERDGRSAGVAYCVVESNRLSVLLDATDGVDLEGLIRLLQRTTDDQATITVRRRWLGERVAELAGCELKLGTTILYAVQPTDPPRWPVRELGPDHPSWRARGWVGFKDLLARGVRYYGIEEAGRIIAWCGLWPRAALRTELIAVGTRESKRGQGYAKAVCAAALNEALRSAPIVTWTTPSHNAASMATARSLGFVPFLETYHVSWRYGDLDLNPFA